MAPKQAAYSHSPINLPDEPQHPDRVITVQDGNFGRVIARVYHTDKNDALENAQMIVDALNLALRLQGFEEEIDFVTCD